MSIVIVPFALLLSIVLIKKIPYIGGNIQIGLVVAAVSALLMGGIYNPMNWVIAWVDGMDRIAWVLALSVFGSIYAETQVRIGTMDTVLNIFRASFGHKPQGLVLCIVLSLVLAGSLLGDSVAATTVIGVLVIKILAEMKMSGEQIAATIVMGGAMGSLMPPVTQSIFLASSLVGVDPDVASKIGYLTIGLGIIICTAYVVKAFVKVDSLPEDLIPKEKAGEIFKKNWTVLIPLLILVGLILLRLALKIDLVTMVFGPILAMLKGIKIIKGLTNLIVASIIIVTIISFFYPQTRKDVGGTLLTGLKNVNKSIWVMCAAGFMLGAFYSAGQIEAVKTFAMALNDHVLKFGGSVALNAIGMLTGSQSTAQNVIFSFFGPALVAKGLDPVHVAIAGSHIASAGQGMPPADLVTFVVCGLVGGVLNIKVDPVKTMIYNLPMCIYLFIVGFIFLYI
jgi:TRAP-type C4-dicarboxylate transport system permease large subunit